KPQTVSFDTH
ncbi:hypothetical protein KIPB_016921, partial [Kipferlia bialata]